MAKIVDISTHLNRLELNGALRWGKSGKLNGLEQILIKIQSKQNFSISEAPVRTSIYGETAESIEAIVNNYYKAKLIGLDLENSFEIRGVLNSIPYNFSAKGAIDMAVAELRAKENNKELIDLINDKQSKIKVSYILGIGEISSMVAEAKRVYDKGVRVLKIKIGRNTSSDLQLISNLKSSFPKDLSLYADANQLLEPMHAAKTLEALANAGIKYIEEPLKVELIKERAALKKENIMPIIADDSCFTIADLERELSFDSFDILNIKPARTGFDLSMQMLSEANAAQKGIMIGSQAGSALGTIHSAIVAADSRVAYPSELSFPLKIKNDIVPAERFESGYLSTKNLTADKIAAKLNDKYFS